MNCIVRVQGMYVVMLCSATFLILCISTCLVHEEDDCMENSGTVVVAYIHGCLFFCA